jgi:hypothetical protein
LYCPGDPFQKIVFKKAGGVAVRLFVACTLNSLQWTDSSAGLVEMIYAFAKGSFNTGNATICEIAEYFEDVFSVHLGNYYRVFQEILCKKKSLTQFMDRLTGRLGGFAGGES